MTGSAKALNFPTTVRFRAEEGLAGAIARAARLNRTSAGEYLRRAVRERVLADGVALPSFDGGDGPRTSLTASALCRAA